MRRYTIEEKRAHVEDFKASGLSQEKYAKLHGIAESTLRDWLIRSGRYGRPAHPQRYKFLNLVAEGVLPSRAGHWLGVSRSTWRHWLDNA